MSSAKGQIQWSDLVVPVGACAVTDTQETAVVGQIGTDSRKWNILHYSAVRNPETMRQVLETYKSETGGPKSDLNTPGPGGYTPLMLAVTQPSGGAGGPLGARSLREPSRSSSSSESSGETNEQNTLLSPTSQPGGVWSDSTSPALSAAANTQSLLDCSVESLLTSRVKIDATNDYGRTALHLAAVCARGDYIKKLLAAGANPNIQDNWGQSPLHAAIGASAEGAFHVSSCLFTLFFHLFSVLFLSLSPSPLSLSLSLSLSRRKVKYSLYSYHLLHSLPSSLTSSLPPSLPSFPSPSLPSLADPYQQPQDGYQPEERWRYHSTHGGCQIRQYLHGQTAHQEKCRHFGH